MTPRRMAAVLAAIGVCLVLVGFELIGFALLATTLLLSVLRTGEASRATSTQAGATPVVQVASAVISVALGALVLAVTWPLVDGRRTPVPDSATLGSLLFGTWFVPAGLLVLVAAVAAVAAATLLHARSDENVDDGADHPIGPDEIGEVSS